MPPGSERIQHLEGKAARLHSTECSGDKLALSKLNLGARHTWRLLEVITFLKVLLQSNKEVEQVTPVSKEELLTRSDIITVHLPLTPATKNFIGTTELSLMQPHTIIINTARGPIVEQNALYNALRKGQIAGAAVDVYDQEPPLPANFELFNAPNLLMLPHIGYATKEALTNRLDIVIKNIEMWLAGTPQNRILSRF